MPQYDDVRRKLQELKNNPPSIDRNNALDVAQLGAGFANMALIEILLQEKDEPSHNGILAVKISDAIEQLHGTPALLNWLEGFCYQIQHALEAAMEGKDIAEAIREGLRF